MTTSQKHTKVNICAKFLGVVKVPQNNGKYSKQAECKEERERDRAR